MNQNQIILNELNIIKNSIDSISQCLSKDDYCYFNDNTSTSYSPYDVELTPKNSLKTLISYNKSTFEEMIQSVIDTIDWDRVTKVMKFLNWKWYNSDFEPSIPTIEENKKFLKSLIRGAKDADSDTYWSQSGGWDIHVKVISDKPYDLLTNQISIICKFCIAEGEYYND